MTVLARLLCFASIGLLLFAPPRIPADDEPESLRRALKTLIASEHAPLPIRPFLVKSETVDHLRMERVVFESEPGEKIYALIFKPENATGRLPAVIWQHWYGGHKENPILVDVMKRTAQRGFLTIAIDGRFRGERRTKDFQDAMIESMRTGKGHPWLIDTAYDITRVVDYLQMREDVDAKRIGVTGVSEGGFESWIAGVIDERIAVVAPVIGVTRWTDTDNPLLAALSLAGRIALMPRVYEAARQDLKEDKINARVVQYVDDKLTPGMRDRFDPAKVMPLLAPRPLFILAHERDQLIPLAGAKQVYEAARKRYAELKAEDKVALRVAPGLPHEAADEAELTALVAWFEKWLK